MAAPVVNYVLIPFKGNINPGYPHWLKLYLKKKEIDKEAEKLDISVTHVLDGVYLQYESALPAQRCYLHLH